MSDKKPKPSGRQKGLVESWTEVFDNFSVFSARKKQIDRMIDEAESGNTRKAKGNK